MKTKDHVVRAGVVVAFIALLSGCSDLKETLPPATPAIGVHPGGWVTKTSSEFHGASIKAMGWDMRSCKSCHGSSYDGGTSQVSCRTCHTEVLGPEHCNVCHGSDNAAPPRDLNGNTDGMFRGVGKHQVHLNGTSMSAAVGCSNCHVLPTGNIYDPAHIDSNPGRAELLFSDRARQATGGTTPTPVYFETSGACANTYCHGAFKNGNSAAVFWNGGAALSTACGSCHGDVTKTTLAEKALPGGTHPNNLACSTCHGGVVNASLVIVNPLKHIDGKLNLNGVDQAF